MWLDDAVPPDFPTRGLALDPAFDKVGLDARGSDLDPEAWEPSVVVDFLGFSDRRGRESLDRSFSEI